MSVKSVDTGNLKNHTHKLNELTMYPHKALILDISGYTGSVLNIDPLPNRNGIDDYVVWVNGVTWENNYDSSTPYTLDLTATGINTTTNVGGLVDGITFTAASARDFLIWGLANNANNGFDGFAATHKPYSAYTGPAAAAKGATITFTGLTSAYQFTVGARAAVRNQVVNAGNPPPYNASPQFEWNWGTITEIVSSTSIKIAMDNNAAYGVALSGATSGEILQWDKFRPWVVTASDQSLYTNNYRLIGELNTDTSGNIISSFRVDEQRRSLATVSNWFLTDNTTPVNQTVSLGRYIPLWSKHCNILFICVSSAVATTYVVGGDNSSILQTQTVAANQVHRVNDTIGLKSYSVLTIASGANNTTVEVYATGYYVNGGMRE